MSRGVGVTFIEMLVVLAIIAGMLALLLPAVQRARESARRASCQNNLRNLTVAMRGFREATKHIPKRAPANMAGGWSVAILPFMEHGNEWVDLQRHPSLVPAVMSEAARHRPVTMTCPSSYEGESDVPTVPVAHYVLAANSNRDRWWIGDALYKSRAAWVVGPEIPYDSSSSGKGPHDGGFHIAQSDGSVRFWPERLITP